MIFRNRATRTFTLLLFAFGLGNLALVPIAQAGMIGTLAVIEQQADEAGDSSRNMASTKQTLVDGLVGLGVDAADAYERVEGLTDQELAYASERLDELPAGGSAIYIIGVVFIVLLILELVGVTNIFNSF